MTAGSDGPERSVVIIAEDEPFRAPLARALERRG
jgi:ActR/RegA family two-component response regulator